MSTKPLVVNRNSRRYKLYAIWSYGRPPKRVWHYRCGVFVMSVLYAGILLATAVLLVSVVVLMSIVVSPLYDHFWPGSWYFGGLHGQPWQRLKSTLGWSVAMFATLILLYVFRKPLRRIVHYMKHFQPKPRPVKVVD